MNAKIRNSYSAYLSSPVTTFVTVDPLLIVNSVDDSEEPFFLWNSLNRVMFPIPKSSGDNCQDASILVEVLAIAEKLLGASEGTENWQLGN